MPEILAFISPDADQKMREKLALLMYMRGIGITDDMKRATIIVMPSDAPKPEETLRKEIEQKEYIFRRLEHISDILPDIVISKSKTKKNHIKTHNNPHATLKQIDYAWRNNSQHSFNRTTHK